MDLSFHSQHPVRTHDFVINLPDPQLLNHFSPFQNLGMPFLLLQLCILIAFVYKSPSMVIYKQPKPSQQMGNSSCFNHSSSFDYKFHSSNLFSSIIVSRDSRKQWCHLLIRGYQFNSYFDRLLTLSHLFSKLTKPFCPQLPKERSS